MCMKCECINRSECFQIISVRANTLKKNYLVSSTTKNTSNIYKYNDSKTQ